MKIALRSLFSLTWLFNDRQSNIKKSIAAQKWAAGIFANACGYTTKIKPGPAKIIKEKQIVVKKRK